MFVTGHFFYEFQGSMFCLTSCLFILSHSFILAIYIDKTVIQLPITGMINKKGTTWDIYLLCGTFIKLNVASTIETHVQQHDGIYMTQRIISLH